MLARSDSARPGLPDPSTVLELCKPITWFPPMWAFLCGAVSSGAAFSQSWTEVALGLLLAGPIVCAMSQVANDWCDRDVDAINQPGRPIPSGRISPAFALALALGMSAVALAVGSLLGRWGFVAAAVAVVCAWAYSAEPLRLKRSGWVGPGVVGLCYEGLPWFTGAAVLSGGLPPWPVLAVAALYAAGAHGIMTLNDFKAIRGDAVSGVHSLPVALGPARAAQVACVTMLVPQVAVLALLLWLDRPLHALAIGAFMLAQLAAMRVLLRDPEGRAPWYNATGVTCYVLGMMVAAFALRGLVP
jgi:chlorophyll synthase